jgi:hypothetical protein
MSGKASLHLPTAHAPVTYDNCLSLKFYIISFGLSCLRSLAAAGVVATSLARSGTSTACAIEFHPLLALQSMSASKLNLYGPWAMLPSSRNCCLRRPSTLHQPSAACASSLGPHVPFSPLDRAWEACLPWSCPLSERKPYHLPFKMRTSSHRDACTWTHSHLCPR